MPLAARPPPLNYAAVASHNAPPRRASTAMNDTVAVPPSSSVHISPATPTPYRSLLSPLPHKPPRTPLPYAMSRADVLLSSGTFRNPSGRPHSAPRMRGTGLTSFMQPATVFMYRGRRSYLHADADLCCLVPPTDFMSKSQLRRLIRVEDSMHHVATSPRASRVRWMHCHESGDSDCSLQSDSEARNVPRRNSSTKAWSAARTAATYVTGNSPKGRRDLTNPKSRTRRRSPRGSGDFIESEWNKTTQAGCHLYVHKRTGDVRTLDEGEDLTSFDGQFGTGSLAYGKENRKEINKLLDFLEGRCSRLE